MKHMKPKEIKPQVYWIFCDQAAPDGPMTPSKMKNGIKVIEYGAYQRAHNESCRLMLENEILKSELEDLRKKHKP